jgi:hypothetical protein
MNFVILFIYLFAVIFLFWEITVFIIKFKSFSKFILFLFLGLLFTSKFGFTFFFIEFPVFFDYLSLIILIMIVSLIFRVGVYGVSTK